MVNSYEGEISCVGITQTEDKDSQELMFYFKVEYIQGGLNLSQMFQYVKPREIIEVVNSLSDKKITSPWDIHKEVLEDILQRQVIVYDEKILRVVRKASHLSKEA